MLNWVSNVSLPNIGCIIGFVDISMGILGNAIPTYCQDHSGRKDRFVFLHFKNICMNTFFEQSSIFYAHSIRNTRTLTKNAQLFSFFNFSFIHSFIHLLLNFNVEFYNTNITPSTSIIKDILEGDNTVAEDCWQRLISVNNGYTAIVH
ncbi:hypothetical protein T05_10584 [Trichinella murrelli]|uniref:Uncharacterized protein n=1 Tax=Trichinella murrelli TaxID=144512 RepID=A0A0V0TK58_9BILA|nr:hypothetical protein T05_10584 [Trichinella murrelli]